MSHWPDPIPLRFMIQPYEVEVECAWIIPVDLEEDKRFGCREQAVFNTAQTM